MPTEEKKLEGLGGWLILVGIGLFVNPIRLWIGMAQIYQGMKSNGSWELIMSGEADRYYPGIKALILGEFTIYALQITFYIVLITLFFMKKRLFPKLFIAVVVLNCLFCFADTIFSSNILPKEMLPATGSSGVIIRYLVYLAIWGDLYADIQAGKGNLYPLSRRKSAFCALGSSTEEKTAKRRHYRVRQVALLPGFVAARFVCCPLSNPSAGYPQNASVFVGRGHGEGAFFVRVSGLEARRQAA